MTRLIVFLVLVLGLGFAFAWVADRPGDISLVWQGMRYDTSLMVAVSAFVALVVAIMSVWWLVTTVLRSPALMRRFFRNRRRDRGYYALSQGLIAAGSGDPAKARKLAAESRKLLGSEPLVELLDAQTSLLEGDHENARTRFERMLENGDTRLVALRGLYLEAEREGAREAARHYAEEAAKASPTLAWAGGAMLRQQSAEADWTGALATLEAMRAAGAIPKAEAQRKRAVLLTAEAMGEAQADPHKAAKLAREAHRLADDLVPAATVAATAMARTGDLRRAANILEATWKMAPHPEIAAAYVHLRHGDLVRERLKRARRLATLLPDDPEGRLAVAEAAVTAADWKAAREAMKPVLADRPTQRACLVMADIEEGEHGDKGRMRDWLARAVRAPRDPVWVADGLSSEHWLPLSPATGRLDAFEWKTPAERIGAPAADLEITEKDIEGSATEAEEVAAEMPQADEAEVLTVTTADAPGATAGEEQQAPPSQPSAQEAGAPGAAAGEERATDKEDNVFPFDHPPDDPGVEPDAPQENEEKAFRLF